MVKDSLVGQLRTGERFTLYPTSPTTFFAKAADWTVSFLPDSAGTVAALDIWHGEKSVRLTRLGEPVSAGAAKNP